MADHPDWLAAVLREAHVRRGLIVYGNVRDLFYSPAHRQYFTLPELLVRLLMGESKLEFTMGGIWDRVDGLRLADERSARRFDAALVRPGTAGPNATAYEVDSPRTSPQTPVGPGRYRDPAELLPAFRQVLAHDHERPVLVMDWSHMLVTHPAHLDPSEREWVLHLGKVMVGQPAVSLDSDNLRGGSRGLLILVAANLGALPPVLYQGDPRIRLLAVPNPCRSQRRAFFLQHADDIRCERPRVATTEPQGPRQDGRESLADTLADLTEQLTIADLQQILTLSLRSPEPLPAERLLNLYRFGDQRSPWEDLSEEKLRQVEPFLQKRVIGQDAAVRHVATMVVRGHMGLAGLQHSARRTKPKGTLFFVGPTGVGKTELAKSCAEFLFGDEAACLRFDMSEYNHEHSDQRLIGAPPGYVGFEEGGQLTNAVRQRPFSVLLFDEIEKSHGRVLDKFLQILEDGRLTDGRGETAYFSECVLIFTSNIGASTMPADADSDQRRRHFLRAVEDHFVRVLNRPELLNRFGDNIVVFDVIKNDDTRRAILRRKVAPLAHYLGERFGIALRLDCQVEEHCLRSARTEHGGRGLLNSLERDLLNPLSRFLFDRKHQLRRGRTVVGTLEGGAVTFDLEES
jgi:hypothetical protein